MNIGSVGISRRRVPKVTNYDIFLAAGPSSLKADDRPGAVATCCVCHGRLTPRSTDLFDTRFGIWGSYSIQACSRCELEQLSPAPEEGYLRDLYERYYNFGGGGDTLYTRLRGWLFSSPLHRLWALVDGDISFYTRKGSGRLLDIGCNEGRGLTIYRANGYEVTGLELNEKSAIVARQKGFPVHTATLNQFAPTFPYDVAVLSNVLEHSLDPTQMLAEVRRVLKPGGEVWISCPNSQSWLRSCFGKYWINWHVPFHIVHFSPSTLERIVTNAGFAGIESRQITPSLWVASSAISWMFARKGQPTRQLRNTFLLFALMLVARLIFCPFLFLGNRLRRGDCLIVVATAEKPTGIDRPSDAPSL